ncbi:alpha-D-ribose 1-methylphosphonate 5-triphosphate diphosphatase [Desulfacinum hydrothermale DSM 13146]|uniref:Alpha-D-ribose 1-methylphosphonate 5-triphosphate diphosphatase n=1 Tax=Desulfacinum hydrothermale DSM 13146 TaxID=1121390 RepID=A0A1W1XHX3_9BACT|nr:alpha-D-ribose 1-methylphosphonate 5-triphosphate diphosphatase [Desulfacinum hydrothermale]SMC23606.1 alpha-D-ribose 1-methylphosphonate 5-triphosphate diphosphatase [Desulfacinum hydrothermale DSM 13146]
MKTLLYGGPLFDGRNLYSQGSILFDEEGILALNNSVDAPDPSRQSLHVDSALIVPALVDLHCDALEKCIEMRPGVHFDPEFALQALDRRLAAAGIGTFCHAVSFADNDLGLRSPDRAAELVGTIRHFARSKAATVRHLVHARYEVGSRRAAGVLMELLDDGVVDVASIMDHTPGQGQFRSFEAYERYYSGTYSLSREEVLAMAREKQDLRSEGWRQVRRVTQRILDHGIPLLSHDDDTAEKVRLVAGLGAGGCEFPVTLEAAREAKARSMGVLVGAPNVVRGVSSNGHLSARSAVAAGVVDALVSDYYPECLLQAPFVLAAGAGGSLRDHLAKTTEGPSKILGPGHVCGSLKPGRPADVAVIQTNGPWVWVSHLWIGGRKVYESHVPSGKGADEALRPPLPVERRVSTIGRNEHECP